MSSCSRVVCSTLMVAIAHLCGCVRIECETNNDCNDGNACTSDVCQGRICRNTPLCTSNSECADGNPCTGDICQLGCCVNTEPACVFDSECSDDNPNTVDACVDGCCANVGCAVDGDCDDGDACTEDTCNTEAGQCANVPVVCTNGESCDSNLGCAFCPFVNCDDGVSCTDDSCDEDENACVHAVNNKSCQDDGQFCNGVEMCDAEDGCVSSGFPCEADETCDETNDRCVGPRGELHGVIDQTAAIPDPSSNGCENADPVDLAIGLAGAPGGSIVSKVKVAYQIEHECVDDVAVELWTLLDNGTRTSVVLRSACEVSGGCGFCSTDLLNETVDDIHHFDTFEMTPNRTWHLEVEDCWQNDTGEIRLFEIWVEYGPP